MDISHETPQQTTMRLRQVLAAAQFVAYPGRYAFAEAPVSQFPAHLIPHALAFVRDDDVWSALVPVEHAAGEDFVVFSFHFPQGLDNSGFVGWLASHLKAVLGTGVFVVCGQNASRGGIFDFWGAPAALAREVIDEVDRLRAEPLST